MKSWYDKEVEAYNKRRQEQFEKIHFTADKGSRLDKIWNNKNENGDTY